VRFAWQIVQAAVAKEHGSCYRVNVGVAHQARGHRVAETVVNFRPKYAEGYLSTLEEHKVSSMNFGKMCHN
jgi:hypothetical protein